MTRIVIPLCMAVICMFVAATAQAQATRTWISGVGDDANPCSRTATCKTFAGAISKTAAGGEIDALDPGGFGAVTITKSITLDGAGVNASILVSGVNGVTINAGVNDVVTLRNLQFQGLAQGGGSTGLNGVQIIQAGAVNIERCAIENFGQNGINVVTGGATRVFIDDTVSRGHTGNGLNIVATATVRVTVSNSRFDGNANGIFAGDFSTTSVRNSDASGNTQSGFVAMGAGGAATLSLIDSSANNNLSSGVSSGGGAANSQIRLANVSITNNPAGLVIGSNGTVVSFGDTHNTGTGAPSSLRPLQ